MLTIEAGQPVQSYVCSRTLFPCPGGYLPTLYATPVKGISLKDIRRLYRQHFIPDVRLFVSVQRTPIADTRNVRGTNYCDIGFKLDERNQRLILISAIDNLVKGAAGQAVQNMNIMLGLDETAGLRTVPFFRLV